MLANQSGRHLKGRYRIEMWSKKSKKERNKERERKKEKRKRIANIFNRSRKSKKKLQKKEREARAKHRMSEMQIKNKKKEEKRNAKLFISGVGFFLCLKMQITRFEIGSNLSLKLKLSDQTWNEWMQGEGKSPIDRKSKNIRRRHEAFEKCRNNKSLF